jgi:hypothetical protein
MQLHSHIHSNDSEHLHRNMSGKRHLTLIFPNLNNQSLPLKIIDCISFSSYMMVEKNASYAKLVHLFSRNSVMLYVC